MIPCLLDLRAPSRKQLRGTQILEQTLFYDFEKAERSGMSVIKNKRRIEIKRK